MEMLSLTTDDMDPSSSSSSSSSSGRSRRDTHKRSKSGNKSSRKSGGSRLVGGSKRLVRSSSDKKVKQKLAKAASNDTLSGNGGGLDGASSSSTSSSSGDVQVVMNPLSPRMLQQQLAAMAATSAPISYRRRTGTSASSRHMQMLALTTGPSRSKVLAAKVLVGSNSEVGDAALRDAVHLPDDSSYLLELGATEAQLDELGVSEASQLVPQRFDMMLTEGVYQKKFYGVPHENWLGGESAENPVVISVTVEPRAIATDDSSAPLSPKRGDGGEAAGPPQLEPETLYHQALIRTRTGTDRLAIKAAQLDSLCLMAGLNSNNMLKLIDHTEIQEDLLKLANEESVMLRHFKIGILLARAGQRLDDEMFANEHATPRFQRFLDWIAEPIELLGWQRFRGGLDVRNGSTGTASYYTEFRDTTQGGRMHPIMFHVSTLLPFNGRDTQHLERKRHLGNDIVVVVFRDVEPGDGSPPFDPKSMHSHFNTIFIVVTPIAGESGDTAEERYHIAVVMREEVDPFGPFLPQPTILARDDASRHMLLLKIINGERSALHSTSFSEKLYRTRTHQLRAVVEKYRAEAADSADADANDGGDDSLTRSRGSLRKVATSSFGSLARSLTMDAIRKRSQEKD
jgi:RAP1 GTPase activating protein 1